MITINVIKQTIDNQIVETLESPIPENNFGIKRDGDVIYVYEENDIEVLQPLILEAKNKIRANTELLFNKGFIYSGLTFGLSDWECLKWISFTRAAESQFPIPVLSKEKQFINLTFETVNDFYDSAFTRGRYIEVEQAKLLHAIDLAETIQEINSIQDTRQ